jgi:hypothetical protein
MQFSCLLVFLQVLGSCDERAVNPELGAANPPQDQVDFCVIIEDHGDQYRPLYQQAKTERNGGSLDQLNAQMAGLFADRNKKIVESLQPRHFQVEEWATTIRKIAHYAQDGGGTLVELDLDASCRVKTTLEVDLAEATSLVAELNSRKVGDPLVINLPIIIAITRVHSGFSERERSCGPEKAASAVAACAIR